MSVQRIYDEGLCMQCGTCAGLCTREAITMDWDRRVGLRLRVDDERCNGCGACVDVCPGEGVDFGAHAWWRERNDGAPFADFLGPYRELWFAWAADDQTRFAGASGGVATAILQGALAQGLIDAAICARVDPENALAVEPFMARTADEIAACRGSKYNVVAMNLLLGEVKRTKRRYALVGLPCHIQGLRRAQERYRTLHERVTLALGIFCGWTGEPRATEVAARRVGLEARDLASVSYRGPDWPGGMRLVARSGESRVLAYPDYFDRLMGAYTPPRCRLCPDGLAELADISVGDAWLERFEGSPGVSDVIVRTAAGEHLMDQVGRERLVLQEATSDEMLTSQAVTRDLKRRVFRGRLWLRARAGRPLPSYPGVPTKPSIRDKVAGARDLAEEVLLRAVGDLRYR